MERSVLGMVLAGLAAVSQADMLVPVTLDCTARAIIRFVDGTDTTNEGVNHAAITYGWQPPIGPEAWAQIDCESGTTDPATVVGVAAKQGLAPYYPRVSARGALVIGTSPDTPAGTPLTLRVTGSRIGEPTYGTGHNTTLKRGADTILFITDQQYPTWEESVPVVAGEALLLNTSFSGWWWPPNTSYNLEFQTVPEPSALLLMVLPALFRRRA